MAKKRGDKINPNSLANLTGGKLPHDRRPLLYDQPKKRHGVHLTQRGWEGLTYLSQQAEISISELLERIGRGLVLIDRERAEVLKLYLDAKDRQKCMADLREVAIPYEQIRRELELG